MSDYAKALFSPFSSDKIQLDNRLAMAPMTRNFSPGYIPTEDVAKYYQRRAENGVGLIITEGTTTSHPASNAYNDVPQFHGEDALAGWKRVVEAVHEVGGKIFPQLWHVGSLRKPDNEPNKGIPGHSPSGLVKPGKKRAHAMTADDIEEAIESFAQAALDAKELGFDGIEIHGAHGYLLDQFFWAGTNERTDEFGGDLVKRTRFVAELVSRSRAKVGPDFPICLRFSQWKQQDYDAVLATNPTELEQFLAPLTDAGVDIFHCSTRRFWEPEFEGSDLNLAGWTKKITGKSTITVGSVGLDKAFTDHDVNYFLNDAGNVRIDNLLERLEKNEFDLVAVGRALLVDPEWGAKIREQRFDEIKPYTKEALATLY